MSVRVRFAPSPTGALHVGSARVMLYNWLFARQNNGQLLLRIEDTDPVRSTEENITEIFRVLDWLNLDFDGQALRQTTQADRHRQALDQLIEQGKVYRCQARREDVEAWKNQHGRERGFRGTDDGQGAYRLRLADNETIIVNDLLRGATTFSTNHLDDPVIGRADRSALYNFAVAIDDADAAITHVIRGDDHLANTPTQLMVFAALGLPAPVYVHLPLILGPDGKKLSKRHKAPDGAPLAVSVEQLRGQGYLPEAILAYLARLGWGTNDEHILSRDQLLAVFDLTKVQTNPAHFDGLKLLDTNAQLLRKLSPEAFAARTAVFLGQAGQTNDARFVRACQACQEKCRTLADTHHYLNYLTSMPVVDDALWAKTTQRISVDDFRTARELIAASVWEPELIELALVALADERQIARRQFLQPIRLALTGSTVSVGLGDTITLLDRDEALARLDQALTRF
jgi:glutamyl-tRNA synthetase